jgi:hypothetical protein
MVLVLVMGVTRKICDCGGGNGSDQASLKFLEDSLDTDPEVLENHVCGLGCLS